MGRIIGNYCQECEWAVTRREHTAQAMAHRAIIHFRETGHDVGSVAISSRDRRELPDRPFG